MRRSLYEFTVAAVVLLGLISLGTGCGRKAGPTISPDRTGTGRDSTTPPEPTVPKPTISLSASPTTIEKGQSATLTWDSNHATGVTIDHGVGTVEPSGSRTVRPSESTTYTARATGPIDSAIAEARVTVTTPPPVVSSDSLLTLVDIFNGKIQDAFFDYDSYAIRPDARRALLENVRLLKDFPEARFTVEGYCDERGSERYNLALGDRRAMAVKELLIDQGIKGSYIDAVSYGEERPFCEEHTENCWQLNRRVRFVLR
jgi:peptidoglycan-associated lipoprotein